MILLVDLDGTLVDRRTAFRTWAGTFVAELGGGADDVEWLLREDADGYRPRADLAASIVERFRLTTSPEQVVRRLMTEHVNLIGPFTGVPARLRSARDSGACVVVVTNGTAVQQTAKLERSALTALVDDVVISETVGVKKPDRQIFDVAVRRARAAGGTGEVWMVGDHPVADIAGARDCGLRTGWVSDGGAWEVEWSPDVVAPTTADVLDLIIGGAAG